MKLTISALTALFLVLAVVAEASPLVSMDSQPSIGRIDLAKRHKVGGCRRQANGAVTGSSSEASSPSPSLDVSSTVSPDVAPTASSTISLTSESSKATPNLQVNAAQETTTVDSTSSSSQVSNASSLSTDATQFLDEHNAFRAKYGAGALAWNNTLADFALTTANTCVFEHSGGPYGENIAASAGMADSIKSGLTGWESEDALYNYGSPGYSGGTGHFTAMVWKATTQLGCAKVSCGATLAPYTDFVVCNYYPPGNMQGAYAENVGQPGA